MRIRKHASRALFSSAPRTLSCAEKDVAEILPAAEDVEASVCRLNQSPWDALPPTPPEQYSEMQSTKEEDRKALVLASACTNLGDFPSAQSELSISTRGKRRTKMEGARKTKSELQSSAMISNETDEAYGPLGQKIRGNNNSKKKWEQKPRNRRMKQRERKDCGSEDTAMGSSDNQSSDIYVYYCGFAPGRGKRRNSCSSASLNNGSGAGFLRGRPTRWLAEEHEEDDAVLGDRERESGADDVIGIKRTGRRPIKSRSLSYLLYRARNEVSWHVR